jgi:PPK2 family polyphosphate:nucleotide phosphotransferase
MPSIPSRETIREFIEPYRVTDGDGFRLRKFDPADVGPITSKDRAKDLLAAGIEGLAAMQEKMYAQNKWALLLIFQAMDAAGKDGVIKHVMSGINPQGCQVHSFKAPSPEELDHDYLWRCARSLPERGRIGIFNRSYYEEVLVVRVHPEYLKAQHLPDACIGKDIWEDRFKDIRNWEEYLSRNGVCIRKFFLHVSKAEQKKRFIERLEEPDKNWKFNAGDVAERAHWDEYQSAYEDAIRHTATARSPWFVVPADNKWYTRLVVAAAIHDAMDSLGLEFPTLDDSKKKELAAAAAALRREPKGG